MARNKLKHILNTILSPAHLELHRRGTEVYWEQRADQLIRESRCSRYLRDLWLKLLLPKTVIDVGANTGQFSRQLRMLVPNSVIYAFEPLPDCFEALQAAFTEDDLFIAFNVGLAESAGELAFERNEFSPSSSFLEVTQAHTDAFPYTQNTSRVVVKIDCLDHVMESLVLNGPILIKVDVQGYEDRVLYGGEKTVRMADTILIETSFVELYKGQPLFDDVYSLLRRWGFAYQGSFDQLRDPRTGETLQEDSVFVKC